MERKRTQMAAEPLLQRAKPATLIAIDDGHGAETPGKRSPAFPDGSVLKENQFNSRTAELLAEALTRCGFATLMVAPEESDTPLKTRVMRANEARADAYISIHANAYGSGWNAANGVETWIYEKIMGQSNTYLFAQSVHEAFAAASGRKDRGLKRSADLYVLKATDMHAVIVECGFMTNREEAELLKSEDYRRKCAEGICKGVCAFYKMEYISPERQEPEQAEPPTTAKPSFRYQSIRDIPVWGQALIAEMVENKCFGDAGRMDLSEDMLRTMVLLDRLAKARKER